MSNPLKVTAALLNSAKGVELNHYIEEINKVAGKRLLTKQGNIDEWWKQIATHFGIDLGVTVPTESVTGPVNIDEKVGQEQWVWIRKLAQEWADTEATGQTFKLWPNSNTLLMPDDKAKLATLLPDISLAHFNSMDCDCDHLQALIGSAEDGDLASLKELDSASHTSQFLIPAAKILVLSRMEGLLEVLEQVQSGLVHWLHEKYGPSADRATSSIWKKIGQQISRRERLMHDFQDEFGGDKDIFLAFFSYEGKVRKKTEMKTWSMRLLVEDIPLCNKCLNAEMLLEKYRDEEGIFSDDLWQGKWGNKNKWEIWYELEPEAKNWK
ncbi:hypothetical protein K439DRAFT_1615724 [Ramaria rubella]|nr:hypothetical protein K439DRAFT_1615724 [Ramaria rubella]